MRFALETGGEAAVSAGIRPVAGNFSARRLRFAGGGELTETLIRPHRVESGISQRRYELGAIGFDPTQGVEGTVTVAQQLER
jgi:hypothetical protein